MSVLSDDAVRERHGCACRKVAIGDILGQSAMTIWEGEEYVNISSCSDVRLLTPWQARYLAAKLYRLSRRIRQRTD